MFSANNTKDVIRNLRERYGLSIRKLGSLIGISFSALSKVERGGGFPNMKTINAMTNFFNVTSDYLLCTSLDGFLLTYECDGEIYCDSITEEQLDKLVGRNEIKEYVGHNCIVREILSNRIIEELKRGVHYKKSELKENPFYKESLPPIEHNYDLTPPIEESTMVAYRSLSDSQKKLVDELIRNLAQGNKHDGK